MDDAKARQAIQAHADAVVSGDMGHVIGDFSEELRPQAPQLAQTLPQPVESAEVVSVEASGDEVVAHIKYTGPDKEQTIRSHWREDGEGTPRIFGGAPV